MRSCARRASRYLIRKLTHNQSRQTSPLSSSVILSFVDVIPISKLSAISSNTNQPASISHRYRVKYSPTAFQMRLSRVGERVWNVSWVLSLVIHFSRYVIILTGFLSSPALTHLQTGSKVLCAFLQDPAWDKSQWIWPPTSLVSLYYYVDINQLFLLPPITSFRITYSPSPLEHQWSVRRSLDAWCLPCSNYNLHWRKSTHSMIRQEDRFNHLFAIVKVETTGHFRVGVTAQWTYGEG